MSAVHENHQKQHEVKRGSERSFGLVFAVLFFIVGVYPLFRGEPLRFLAVATSVIFLVAALLFPTLLRPLNAAWFTLGMLLHVIVTPVIMGLLFFVIMTPLAAIIRLFTDDPLRRSFDRTAQSYWIVREPPGPPSQDMKNQF